MPARTGRTTYIPGRGATTRSKSGKAKSFVGKGPAPSGTKKLPEPSYTEVPTVTVTSAGTTTTGFKSKKASRRAVRAQKAAERRVQRVVKETKRTPQKRAEAPAKYTAPKSPKPTQPNPLAKPETFQGAKTAGTPTRTELKSAAKAGTLRVNKKGFATTPKLRQAAKKLKRAKRAVAKTTGLTGPLTPGQKTFARQVAKRTGLSPRVVAAQALAEESGEAAQQREAEGNHNWLNIGYFDSGPGELTQGSEWADPRSAAKATAEFFKGKRYGASPAIQAIVPSAKGKSDAEQIAAIGNSDWATSGVYRESIEGTHELIGQKRNPKAVRNLKAAQKTAKKAGLKPTKSAGDLSRGKGRTVYVRADAKGMVKWAESALGTSEGTTKQLRWAAKTGLGGTEPWCANFVSNGLLRRGITSLPSNPNYVPSYEEWGAKYAVKGGLAKAKPGDLLTFSGSHIGIYVGSEEMVSGNSSDAVSRTSAGSPSMVIRPPYKGGKIAIQESAALPGSVAVTSSSSTAPAAVGFETSPSAKGTKKAKGQALTPLQNFNQTNRQLRDLGVGQGKQTKTSGVLDELAKKYGVAG